MQSLADQQDDSALSYAVGVILRVCQLAGNPALITDLRTGLRAAGLVQAVERHDTAALFDWLMQLMSYQGIANRIVDDYLAQHGSIHYAEIEGALARGPTCPKLQGHWQFDGCLYQKGSGSCAEPWHLPACPLPLPNLRNGRLNQTAYSLFFFLRDVADNDLVAWLDQQLTLAARSPAPDALAAMRDAIIEPLRSIYGISHKVIAMVLAGLLLGTRHRRSRWFAVGASMVVVDTLVHNFLQRTGILRRCGAVHPYGLGCYRPGGCADIIQNVAQQLDAREFNPGFPAVFPRFVQQAIWRYCANEGLDICNGNRIADEGRCEHRYCRLYHRCDREPLRQ